MSGMTGASAERNRILCNPLAAAQHSPFVATDTACHRPAVILNLPVDMWKKRRPWRSS